LEIRRLFVGDTGFESGMDERLVQQELYKERSAHLQTTTKLQAVEKEFETLKQQLTNEKEAHERAKLHLRKLDEEIAEMKKM